MDKTVFLREVSRAYWMIKKEGVLAAADMEWRDETIRFLLSISVDFSWDEIQPVLSAGLDSANQEEKELVMLASRMLAALPPPAVFFLELLPYAGKKGHFWLEEEEYGYYLKERTDDMLSQINFSQNKEVIISGRDFEAMLQSNPEAAGRVLAQATDDMVIWAVSGMQKDAVLKILSYYSPRMQYYICKKAASFQNSQLSGKERETAANESLKRFCLMLSAVSGPFLESGFPSGREAFKNALPTLQRQRILWIEDMMYLFYLRFQNGMLSVDLEYHAGMKQGRYPKNLEAAFVKLLCTEEKELLCLDFDIRLWFDKITGLSGGTAEEPERLAAYAIMLYWEYMREEQKKSPEYIRLLLYASLRKDMFFVYSRFTDAFCQCGWKKWTASIFSNASVSRSFLLKWAEQENGKSGALCPLAAVIKQMEDTELSAFFLRECSLEQIKDLIIQRPEGCDKIIRMLPDRAAYDVAEAVWYIAASSEEAGNINSRERIDRLELTLYRYLIGRGKISYATAWQ